MSADLGPLPEPVPVHNPWRVPLENCISGSNYLRASEYRDLIEELDELCQRREWDRRHAAGVASAALAASENATRHADRICAAAQAHAAGVAAGVPADMMAMARRLMWIAYCWNDHNFQHRADEEARIEARKHGINSFKDANVWLAASPTPPAPTKPRYTCPWRCGWAGSDDHAAWMAHHCPQPVQAPPGWVMVPLEATRSMCAAAVIDVNGPAVYKNVAAAALEIEERIYGEAYSAMIAAAPDAPAPAPTGPAPAKDALSGTPPAKESAP